MPGSDDRPSDASARSASVRRWRRVAVVLGVVLLVWVGAGLRSLDPSSEFGVIDGPLLGGGADRIDGRWAVAPPGLLRLTRYPLHAVELVERRSGKAVAALTRHKDALSHCHSRSMGSLSGRLANTF